MARKPPKLSRSADLAQQINVYLKRFEADKTGVNAYYLDPARKGLRPFYSAGARANGGRVFVVYIAYQGSSSLTIAEATAYLAWLDAGNTGRHFEQQRQAAKGS